MGQRDPEHDPDSGKAASRTHGVWGRDNVCIYHNMTAKKRNSTEDASQTEV